jgi:hypothetical protein
MRRSPLVPLVLAVLAGALLCALPTLAAEQKAPTPAPVVTDHGPDASDGTVPAVSSARKPLPRVPLVLRTVPTPPAGDKGSQYTDGGVGEAMTAPTEHERMKLDRARQAVEASRAAGLLLGASRPVTRLALSPAEMEEEKFRAMERWKTTPRTTAHHPSAGVGDGMQSVQLQGPQELSVLERQKLDAFLRGETFVAPPAAPAKPSVEPSKVDAGRKPTKEGQ